MITQETIDDEVAKFRNGFMGSADGAAPAQDGASDEVDRFREGFKGGEKVAGMFDFMKPAGDGVSSQTHAAMKEAGVGPYEGSNAKPSSKPGASDDGSAGIMDARARDKKNREIQMMETIKKAYPQKEWDRVLKEKMKAEGW
jgi:hypothetical protein